MKIFKHTFKTIEDYELVDGEFQPIEKEYTMHFSLNNKGQLIFEREYGKGMMEAFAEADQAGFTSDMIRALAVATYKGTSHFSDDEANAIEFKESPVYFSCCCDGEFIQSLTEMVVDCLNFNKPNAKAPAKGKSNGKK